MPNSVNEEILLKKHISRTVWTSFFLGSLFGISCVGILHAALVSGSAEVYAFFLYLLIAHVFFHLAEFLVPLWCRSADARADSFLLFHSTEYIVMSVMPFLEFLIKLLLLNGSISFFPAPLKLTFTQASICGLLATLFYGIRVVAMIQCGTNFSFCIEVKKRRDHELVTHGLYSVLRHPSYFGFFWRTVILQLILGNTFTFLTHTVVVWIFFKERVRYEERILQSESFFGSSYVVYKLSTWVGIPFI